jgi:uncharacterized protein
LKQSYAEITLPVGGVDRSRLPLPPGALRPGRGEEGVTAQGAVLIGMLVLIGWLPGKGIENIHEGFNAWTWIHPAWSA